MKKVELVTWLESGAILLVLRTSLSGPSVKDAIIWLFQEIGESFCVGALRIKPTMWGLCWGP